MESGSTQPCYEPRDCMTVTVGNTIFMVEHIYNGDRTLPEVMGDFLERELKISTTQT